MNAPGGPLLAPLGRSWSARRSVWRAAALATVVPLLVAGASSALARPSTADVDASTNHGHEGTEAALETMVEEGTPGVVAQVDRGPHRWTTTAGVAEMDQKRPRTAVDHFRIGSITKTFIAVTLLDLEAEGELSLDDTLYEWLPGVLTHDDYDGTAITVRQLLNHTSGIYDLLDDPRYLSRYRGQEFFRHRYDDWTPVQLIDLATSNPPEFEPGEGWSYSQTNYILAGMVIEAITGRSYADVVEDRLIEPLRLRDTSVPGHSPNLPEPHAHGYSRLFVSPDAPIHDVTEFDPSLAGASGEMISTTRDLNRFFTELMAGNILPAEQQRQLLTGVESPRGHRYGLGVQTYGLPCGTTLWGNDGDIFGSVTYTVSTADGDHVLSFNANEHWTPDENADAVVAAEFCS